MFLALNHVPQMLGMLVLQSATSSFIVRDTGNCSPRMMRCTLNMIPCSGDLLSTSGMPLALMVQPLALDPAEELIQVVDFGDSGPVRCAAPQCRGYINPFMKFIDQGHRFICNLCGKRSLLWNFPWDC
jgi:protein transport protein SEC24